MSGIITWDDKYSIGIELIDNQHQKLFEYLNFYYESLLVDQGDDVTGDLIKNMLNNLTGYAQYHFSEEEKVMNSIKGVDFSSHFDEHKDFCSRVTGLRAKVFLGENITYELFDFMKDWLLTHILLSDQKIGKAYKDKFL
jgi:hemerythrin